jgi:hypothetical protein
MSKANRTWPGSRSTKLPLASKKREPPEAKPVIVMVPSPLSTIEWSLLLDAKTLVRVPPVSRFVVPTVPWMLSR